MRRLVLLLGVAFFFFAIVGPGFAQKDPEFEKFLQQNQNEFASYKKKIEQEFKQYKQIIQEEFERYKKEINT